MRSGKILAALSACILSFLCAAIPAAAQPAGVARPIPKAGEWALADDLPPAKGCAAMLRGDNVDVNLLETNDGHMLLVASRPDWQFNPGPAKFRFQVDAGPQTPIEGDLMANLLLTPVDAELEAALSKAKSVTWHLPDGGAYHAQIEGLKTAFAALKACNVRKGVKH